jgi:hypothetical protein
MKSFKMWVKGLLAAAIGGLSTGVTNIIVDPNDFNFDAGLGKLGKVCLVSALLSAALYLKQSPVPPDASEEGK